MNTKKLLMSLPLTLLCLALSLIWLVPLIWMIGTAFSKPVFSMTLLPVSGFSLENITHVWNTVTFGRYYINTIVIVVSTFAIQFVTITLAAYALANLKFKGQSIVFAIIFIQIKIGRASCRERV